MDKILQEKIYQEYKDKILFYILGKGFSNEDAEDLRSAVFEKVFSNFDRFDSEKASVSTWIYRITHNLVIDFWRTHKSNVELPETIEYVDTSFDKVLKEEMLEKLSKALLALDERSRDLIVLVYYKNMTLKSVSEKLGMSYSNSKLVIKKAMEQLKEIMEL